MENIQLNFGLFVQKFLSEIDSSELESNLVILLNLVSSLSYYFKMEKTIKDLIIYIVNIIM